MILRTSKKKASLDAMLNSAVTKQLEGIRKGVNNFSTSLDDITDVKKNYTEMNSSLVSVPDLVENLREIQEENKKFSQLKIAMKNINHIIRLPDNVKKAFEYIDDGKLFMVGLSFQSQKGLYNHKCPSVCYLVS